MKIRTFWKPVVIALVFALLSQVLHAQVQPFRGRPADFFNVARELSLTDEQQEKLLRLEQEFSEAMAQYDEVMKSVRAMVRELKDLEGRRPRDEEAIAERRRVLGKTLEPVRKLRLEYIEKVKAILNPDQIQEFESRLPGREGLFGAEGPNWIAELALTPEQIEKLRALRDSERPKRGEVERIHSRLVVLEQEVRTLRSKVPPDRAAIRRKEAEIKDLQLRLRNLLDSFRKSLEAILTPEQREKFRVFSVGPLRPGGPLRRFIERLDLTPDQRAKLEEIFRRVDKERETRKGQLERIAALREEIMKLQGEEKYDEASLKRQEFRSLMRELGPFWEKYKKEIEAVLTPEQRDQLRLWLKRQRRGPSPPPRPALGFRYRRDSLAEATRLHLERPRPKPFSQMFPAIA